MSGIIASMIPKVKKALVTVLLCGHLAPSGVAALSCKTAMVPYTDHVKSLFRRSDVVFSGSVVEGLSPPTVHIERVWKGALPLRVALNSTHRSKSGLYFARGPSAEGIYSVWLCPVFEDRSQLMDTVVRLFGPGAPPREDFELVTASWFVGISLLAVFGASAWLVWLFQSSPRTNAHGRRRLNDD